MEIPKQARHGKKLPVANCHRDQHPTSGFPRSVLCMKQIFYMLPGWDLLIF